jgi:molybdate transport system ATP-binding protein
MSIQLQFQHQYSSFDLSLTLDLPSDGISVVLGESGSGKTTLLRLIAGLEKPKVGRVQIGEAIWQDAHNFLPAHQRSVGFVFQEARLFPHLSVLQNIQYAAKRSQQNQQPILIDDAIACMQISHLLDRKPEHLSGGEQQRVAITRALATQPSILLMDEPLASLDEALKEEILPYIASIRTLTNMPMVYVTHALNEAKLLADFVLNIHEGRQVRAGTAAELMPFLITNTLYDGSVLNAEEKQLLRFFRAQSETAKADILKTLKTTGHQL